MGIKWEDARRVIPNLDAVLDRYAAGRRPDGLVIAQLVAAGQPVAVEVEHAPGRWSVTIAGWRPASDNLRAKGWHAFHRAKKRDREVIRTWVCEYACVPRATGRRRLSAWVTKRGPLVDGTNLWKSLADGCVQTGLLKDDGGAWFEAGRIEVARGAGTSTKLLIEDIES